MDSSWRDLVMSRKRIFEIIEVGNDLDHASRAYDFLNAFAIIINLAVSIMYTFDDLEMAYGTLLLTIEEITVAFFCIDYVLRVWTAKYLYRGVKERTAIKKYVLSFTGIIDLLSFLPYYLPIFFPGGTVAFRMIRIVRIFRLFKINAYYDSLNVITEVIYGKKQQIISSVFIIVILMIASSLCMYSIEHEAQPDVFQNAFSGIWWSASTLLTVGYGDIYPITIAGKILGIAITFLGVGMVAIPTGIISAGFVEQYAIIKKVEEYGHESDMQFIKIHLYENDNWVGKAISELELPTRVIVALVKRQEEILIPRGNLILEEDDMVILGAEPFDAYEHIHLKEFVLKRRNPWTNQKLKDLDISRHSVIVLVKRGSFTIIPNGETVLREGDKIFMYSKLHLSYATDIEI